MKSCAFWIAKTGGKISKALRFLCEALGVHCGKKIIEFSLAPMAVKKILLHYSRRLLLLAFSAFLH
jgi:hypothetical protein